MSYNKRRYQNASKAKIKEENSGDKKPPSTTSTAALKKAAASGAEKNSGGCDVKQEKSAINGKEGASGEGKVKGQQKEGSCASSSARCSQEVETSDSSEHSPSSDRERPKNAENNNENSSSNDKDDNTGSNNTAEETDCKKRKKWCAKKMVKLEQQFCEIKEALYVERLQLVETQIKQVKDESSEEYKKRLKFLEETSEAARQTACALRRFQILEAKLTFDGETIASRQDYDNKLTLLYETLQDDVENNTHKLENDKQQADIDFELWQREHHRLKNDGFDGNETDCNNSGEDIGDFGSFGSKKTKTSAGWSKVKSTNGVGGSSRYAKNWDKRRKCVTVTGPYVVYNLEESQIMEDYKIIQRAIIQADLRDKFK